MFTISIVKKGIIHIRTSIKFIIIVSISIFLIISAIALFYKPIYSVSINGEFIGYAENKSKLQNRINEYMQNGNEENVAFVDIDSMPEYKLYLLKKGISTNDDEIYNKVISTGITYYKNYALVLSSGEEKFYVSTFQEAEQVVNELKEKKSANIENINIVEKYSAEVVEVSDTETCVTGLYEKKKTQPVKVASKTISQNRNFTGEKIDIGISFINPTSGRISSRFGIRNRNYHTGIDIASPTGTPIYAASGGTVVSAGWSGAYGNLVIISHGNGIQTYYAHCNAIYVKVGQEVVQGQHIAAMGSTGRSTGPHLHFEVRINGVAQNPQNYVY